jgi:hypothetical protein
MKIALFTIFLTCSVGIPKHSLAQIQKGSWHLGLSTAPLFELNSTGLNGALINLHAERSFSNRFIFGVQPYYALTDEKMQYAFDLISMQPRGIQKNVFRSLGMNTEFKFVLHRTQRIIPYSSVLLGIGYTNYKLYQNNVFGELVPNGGFQLVNYNLGIAFGTYINFSNRWYMDIKVSYIDAYDNQNMEVSNYLFPSVGMIRSF